MIHLSDVADVDWSVKDADSIARFNGEDTVTISMTKNQSASTIGMVNDVKKVMKNISEQNENAVIEASYDASEMIFESLSSVGSTLALSLIHIFCSCMAARHIDFQKYVHPCKHDSHIY